MNCANYFLSPAVKSFFNSSGVALFYIISLLSKKQPVSTKTQSTQMLQISFLSFYLLFFFTAFSQTIFNPANIDIVRDSFGVPHIFAKTDAEVAYGLAWAEAEDDFKSMQEIILPAKNLMAGVMGKKGAAGDYAFALFRCREITEEKWNTLTPAFLKLIDGYFFGMFFCIII